MNPGSRKTVHGTLSPFNLADETTYQRWRDWKLDNYPAKADDLLVEVKNPLQLSPAEQQAILERCQKANMAVYVSDHKEDKAIPRQLGQQFGLKHLDPNILADEDGITSLQVVEGKSVRGYIPYSNRRLLWHTDGYYNPTERQIRAFILHCVQPAAEGGENRLLDPEILYIWLRDKDPALIQSLMHGEAMTIPANEEQEAVYRPAQTGPVFSVEAGTGCLHMRYTARTRSIEWREDAMTTIAVDSIKSLLESDFNGIFSLKLQSGMGVICNNVLHSREGFENSDKPDEGRLMYRARYYERIQGTYLADIPY